MPSQHLEFSGSQGRRLAGRLDLPDTTVRGFAVHAHCFTCSKDGLAAFHLGKALSQAGVAMLRFDFSGLGDSQGRFSDVTFSDWVADYVAAARCLAEHHGVPRLLLGHSLGGAIAIAAAQELPDAAAIATIGAPFEPATVIRQFGEHVELIRQQGQAQVKLAGRSFTITRALLEDLEAQRQEPRVRELRRPLLVLHSPLDATVPIEEAGKIFQAALHPKSFVSLDRADHLLTRPTDTQWLANMICAWVAPYLEESSAADDPPRG